MPVHFFSKGPLFSIARLIGEPIKLDASTASLTRPSVARFCVEVNLQEELPENVWIGNGHPGFWQHVEYENLPAYCSFGHKIGHDEANCHNNPEGLQGQPQCQPIKQVETQQVWKAKPMTQQVEEIAGPTLIMEHQPHATEKAAPAVTVLCTSQAMANGAGSLQDIYAGPRALAVGLAAAAEACQDSVPIGDSRENNSLEGLAGANLTERILDDQCLLPKQVSLRHGGAIPREA